MDADCDKIIHDINRHGSLYYLLSAFIGAYNRRTDAIARANATDPAEIAALTARLKASHDALETAINNSTQE
jgi:hypothetical protein